MKFKEGDRVASRYSGRTGTIVTAGGTALRTKWDDGRRDAVMYPEDLCLLEAGNNDDSIHVDNVVNHPAHYTGFSNGAEVIDITENLNFNRGNAVKYLARAGTKDPGKEVQDLKKALWYVAREIERLEKKEDA